VNEKTSKKKTHNTFLVQLYLIKNQPALQRQNPNSDRRISGTPIAHFEFDPKGEFDPKVMERINE
jgi:hypothetical protein